MTQCSALILTLGACLVSAPGVTAKEHPELRCGAYCLFIALRSLDFPVPAFKDLEESLGPPSPVGYSMQQLADAATAFGAHTLGLKTSLDHLERRTQRFACIALLEDSGHFVCVYDLDAGSAYIIDPPESRVVAREAFNKLWGGNALLISDTPIEVIKPARFRAWVVVLMGVLALVALAIAVRALGKGRARSLERGLVTVFWAFIVAGCSSTKPPAPRLPHARIGPAVVDMGTIEVGQNASQRGGFTISNDGSGPLKILSCEASCGCTVLDGYPGSVAAGSHSAVYFVVKARNETGVHESFIALRTNDPATPLARVQVRWSEHYALSLTPRILDIGWVETGETSESVVEVFASPHVDAGALKVKSVGGLSCVWLDAGSARREFEGGTLVIRKLNVKTPIPSSPGICAGEVRVSSANGEYVATLPVTWRSGPPVEISPTVFFESGVKPGATVQKELFIKAKAGKQIRVVDVRIDGKKTSFGLESFGAVTGSAQLVKFTLSAGNVPGTEKHELGVVLDGDRSRVFTAPVVLIIQ